jgi:4-diphosphocytidyl-2-C-methyl-D-erythritol kinase
MAVERLARAKINLALHVTGQRSDGYHLLDSLVAFADIGDTVRVAPADGLRLTIEGPMASDLPVTEDNLVLRAARLFPGHLGAAIHLTKRLPIASGIGGGSADAAATLLALSDLWSLPLPPPEAILTLGADVPVCLSGRPAHMRGIGEIVEPLSAPLPPAWLVLANPGVAVSTPAIFRALTHKTSPPLTELPGSWPDVRALAQFLSAQRNDLAPAACALAPVITETLTALAATPGCALARMSGSGATCFGLFASEAAAKTAAEVLRRAHPNWWTASASLSR